MHRSHLHYAYLPTHLTSLTDERRGLIRNGTSPCVTTSAALHPSDAAYFTLATIYLNGIANFFHDVRCFLKMER